MNTYKIFTMATCPYCQKVQRFVDKHGLDAEWLDIHEGDNESKLVNLGGAKQVPALILDDDKIMYESNDIINHIAKDNQIEIEAEDLESDANFCPIF